MEKLSVTFKTVTPLFLGGADPTEKAELRPASIKGALRFWYRAIDPDYNRAAEEEIFGSTDAGQCVFGIKAATLDIKPGLKGDARWEGKKTAYLGYGPIIRDKDARKSLAIRHYINSGSRFIITLFFNKRATSDVRGKIERTLWAFSVMGGLGSRSRKGFGSLVVTDVVGAESKLPWRFAACKELQDSLNEFIRCKMSPHKGVQEYTRWSEKARCVVTNEKENGEAALEWLGAELHNYRSFRGDKPANFVSDHDAVLNYLKTGAIANPPLRTAFGLPHNYFFTKSLPFVPAEINLMEGKQKGRRASPLLLHIQELTSGKSCVVATFMPARLIPAKSHVTISGQGQSSVDMSLADDFTAIDGFMDRLAIHGKEVS